MPHSSVQRLKHLFKTKFTLNPGVFGNSGFKFSTGPVPVDHYHGFIMAFALVGYNRRSYTQGKINFDNV